MSVGLWEALSGMRWFTYGVVLFCRVPLVTFHALGLVVLCREIFWWREVGGFLFRGENIGLRATLLPKVGTRGW